MNPAVVQFVSRFWIFGAFAVWAGALLGFGVIRLDTFGIEEGSARALLLNWAVSDNLINPVLTMGLPDFRALLFVPVGIYWAGNMLAAKILTLAIGFFGVALLYRWASGLVGSEAALVASALLVVSPALVGQIDAMGTGPFLILGFAMGVWLDKAYRAIPGYFGGWYFCQVLWIGVLVTLHPMALAYPVALAWRWLKHPDERKTSRHMFIGIAVATSLALVLTRGWNDIGWLSNPIKALGNATMGGVQLGTDDIRWVLGTFMAGLALSLLWLARRKLTTDFGGTVLVASIALGSIAADGAWATLVMALVLYFGVEKLISLNQMFGIRSFIGQRGLLTTIVFVTCTWFMVEAKAHAAAIASETLSPQDDLIRLLGEEASHKDRPFRAASQWPGRSMLVARRDVFPLPPASLEKEELRKALKGLTHMAFDPFDKRYKPLADKLADMVESTETLALQKGGVLLAIRDNSVKLELRAPAAVVTPAEVTPAELTPKASNNTAPSATETK